MQSRRKAFKSVLKHDDICWAELFNLLGAIWEMFTTNKNSTENLAPRLSCEEWYYKKLPTLK